MVLKMKELRRTNIVGTIGPASESEEMLTKLVNAGLNVTRINFSHGGYEENAEKIAMIKRVREKLNKPLNTKITRKEYSIERRIEDIRKILKVRDKIEFLDLFNEPNRDFMIVTFLSILTMSKNDEITLTQEDNFKPILIERRSTHE